MYIFRKIINLFVFVKNKVKEYSPISFIGLVFPILSFLLFIYYGKVNDFIILIIASFLLIFFLLLLILNLINFGINYFRIKKTIELSLQNKEIFANKELKVNVNFKSFFIIPSTQILGKIVFSPPYYQGETRKLNISSNRYEDKIIFYERGLYTLEGLKLTFKDILGLFHFTKLIRKKVELIVYPLIRDPKKINFLPNYNIEDYKDQTEKKIDAEYFDMRKYEVGDDVRRIHWKLLAKKNELIVRIPEKNEPLLKEIVTIFTGYNPLTSFYNNNLMRRYLNEAVIEITSIINQFYENNFKIYFCNDTSVQSEGTAFFDNKKGIFSSLAKTNWINEKVISNLYSNFLNTLNQKGIQVNTILFFCTPFCFEILEELFSKINLTNTKLYFIYFSINDYLSKEESSKLNSISIKDLLFTKSFENREGKLINFKGLSIFKNNSYIKSLIIRNDEKILNSLDNNNIDYTVINLL